MRKICGALFALSLSLARPYEMKGQYAGGTVFIQGLVHFKNQWLLYYGTADSAVGVASLTLK